MRTGPWPARVPWTRLRKADGGLGQVSIIWLYVGISPGEMAEVVTIVCERSLTTSVNDIERQDQITRA